MLPLLFNVNDELRDSLGDLNLYLNLAKKDDRELVLIFNEELDDRTYMSIKDISLEHTRIKASFDRSFPTESINEHSSLFDALSGIKRYTVCISKNSAQSNIILQRLPINLEFLRISSHYNISLNELPEKISIRQLEIAYEVSGLDRIGKIQGLEELLFDEVDSVDINGLRNCSDLTDLRIYDTKIKNSETIGNLSLRALHIGHAKGVNNYSFISKCRSLIELDIEGQKNLTEIPDLSGLNSLQFLALGDTPNLKEINCLRHAPSLRSVLLHSSKLKTEDARFITQMPNIETVKVAFPDTDFRYTEID